MRARVSGLILSLLGISYGAQFCLPKVTYLPIRNDSTLYPMSQDSFNVLERGYAAGRLPEGQSNFVKHSKASPSTLNVFTWDLLSTPLAFGLSAAGEINKEHHFIETGDFRLTVTLSGVVDSPADPSEPDRKFDIKLTCGTERDVLLNFTYPNSKADLGTRANWFVAYSIIESELVVRASNDEVTLPDEDSRLSSASPDLSEACVDALNTEQAKGGTVGATVTFGINQDNHPGATSTSLLDYPYNLDSSKITVVKQNNAYHYILNKDTLPSYSGSNNFIAYQFPAESCTSIKNYHFGSMNGTLTTEQCPEDPTVFVRRVDCMFPAAIVDTETGALDAESCDSRYCCSFKETQGDSEVDKCYASSDIVCTLSNASAYDIAYNARTTTTIGGVELTTDNINDYKVVYLGEEVEFSCKPGEAGETYLLRYDPSFLDIEEFGEFNNIKFKCLAERSDDYSVPPTRTTDIKMLFDKVKCEAACIKPEIHDSVEIDVVFSDESPFKPAGTIYTFTCKDGFGTAEGKTAAGNKTCSGAKASYVEDVQCYQCVVPALNESNSASFSAETAIPGGKMIYKCNEGYSLEEAVAYGARKELNFTCKYNSSASGAFLERYYHHQCFKDCPLLLPENHGLLFEFDGEATTIESVPRAEHYNLSCADDGHTLPFGQNVRVSCIKFDPGQEPASIEVKGCHKPCSVVTIKETYYVEYKSEPDGIYINLTDNEVSFGTPLKLTGCVDSTRHLFSTERDNNEITCSDDYYDFDEEVFKNLIECYYPPTTNQSAVLDQYPLKAELRVGSVVTLSCIVEGFPLPTAVVLTQGQTTLVSYDEDSWFGEELVQSAYDESDFQDAGYQDELADDVYYGDNYPAEYAEGGYPHPLRNATDPSQNVEKGENFILISKTMTLQLNDTSLYKCEGYFGESARVLDTRNLTVVSDVEVRIAVSNHSPRSGQWFYISCNVTGGRRPHKVEIVKNFRDLIVSTERNETFCHHDGNDEFALKCQLAVLAGGQTGLFKYACIGTNIVANGTEKKDEKSVFVFVDNPALVKIAARELQTAIPTSQIVCEAHDVLETYKVILTKPDSSNLTWERYSPTKELDCNGTNDFSCNYTIINPGFSYEGIYKCEISNTLHGDLRNSTDMAVLRFNGSSFCDKCSDDAYKRGLKFASEGCYNCACRDGSRQCGCQPSCPAQPARPYVIQRVMVPLNISMVTQNGTTNSYSHNYDTYMNLEPGSEVEAENGTPFNFPNGTSINFGPGSAIDGDDETFSATNYACGEDIQFLWYKVEFKRLLAVDEVHITVALLEKFLTKMNETLKIAVLRGSNEYSCGTVTYWFQQDRLSFNVTCNGVVGEGVIARKVHNNKNITMCDYLAIAEIAVYETFRDEIPENKCGNNEFLCHDNSTCLLKSQQCDGRVDCTDGSDETNCPDNQLDCAPLPHPTRDNNSTLSCSDSSTCHYSCVNSSEGFPLDDGSGKVRVVSALDLKCDRNTSQWSHMSVQNPLGHLPSCREVRETVPVLELVMRFSPSHNRSRRSITAHQNTCPLHGELELEVLRNIEGLELVVVAKGKCYSMEIPICVQLADVRCVVIDDGALQVTSILEFIISKSVNLFENEVLNYFVSNLIATNFSIVINGTSFGENNGTSALKTSNCPEGFAKVTFEVPSNVSANGGVTLCLPCDRGEFYNSGTSACELCPINTYSWRVGSTECTPCPEGAVTPRTGTRLETQCVPPDEICTIRGEAAGRRSLKPGTKVTTNSGIMTYCNFGYSLAYNSSRVQTCSFLDKTPTQCYKACEIILPKSTSTWSIEDVRLYDENNKYKEDFYLRYQQVVKYSCLGKYGTATCDIPGGNVILSECEIKLLECPKLVEVSAVYGNYTWPKTTQNNLVKLPCYWDNNFKARKICSERGFYEKTDFMECPSAVAEEISDILEEAQVVTINTQDSVSTKIKDTTAESGKQMSSSDVKNTVKVIDVILEASELEISKTTLTNLMSTMDNVQTNTQVSEVRRDDTSDRLRESAVKIVGEIAETKKKDAFTPLNSIGFAVAVVSEDRTVSENKNVLALAGTTNNIAQSTNQDDIPTTYFRAEIITADNELATAVYYETDKAFPSNAVSSESSVYEKYQIVAERISKTKKTEAVQQSSEILGEVSLVATVISDINIVDKNKSYEIVNVDFSDRKFEMMFTVKEETELYVHRFTKRKTLVTSKLTCKFYDTTSKLWSDKGCTTNSVSYDEEKKESDVICSCDHLTSFAVLMSFTSEESLLEELVSHILLGISLFFLLLTLLAIIPNKKSLKMRPTQINVMLVLALTLSIICFFLMDFFVAADEDAAPSISCSVVAFLLNYFWLCQLTWMILEAVTMYIALVQVFGTYISKAFLKFSLIGWSAPLVFPIIGIAWGGTEFADPKTCFIKYPYGLVSFYGPVVLGVVVNWILFFFIARVILKASKAKAMKTGDSNVKMRTKQLQSAFAVSTLLGLSWIIGFFLLMNNSNYGKISLVFRWLFIAFNAPQGFFIFLFYVLLKEDVRKFWLQKFKRKVKSPVTYTGVTSNDKDGKKKMSTSVLNSSDLHSITITSTEDNSLVLINQHSNRKPASSTVSNVKTKPGPTHVTEVHMPRPIPVSLELEKTRKTNENEYQDNDKTRKTDENEYQDHDKTGKTDETEYQDNDAVYWCPDDLEVTLEPVSGVFHPQTDIRPNTRSKRYVRETSENNAETTVQIANDNIYADEQVHVQIVDLQTGNSVALNEEEKTNSCSEYWVRTSLDSDPMYSDLPEPTTQQAPQIAQQAPQIAQRAPQIAQRAPQIAQQAPQIAQQAPQIAQQAPQIAQQAPQIAQQAPQTNSQNFEFLLLSSEKMNNPKKEFAPQSEKSYDKTPAVNQEGPEDERLRGRGRFTKTKMKPSK
ncbi:hypothetical protein ACHWQZ_G013126 [Mnemiopsis leidyi]